MAITIEKEIYLNVAEAGALIDRSKNTIYNRYKKSILKIILNYCSNY